MYIIAKENFIEYWDFGAYKNFALTQGKMLFDDPLGTLQALYQSINTAEYNNLLALMISIPLMLLGGGYGACNLLVVFLFIIPFAIAFALLMRCLLQKYGLKQISFYWFVLLGFIIPPVFIPALQGYCDASVLLPIAAVTLLTLTRDLGKFNWKKNLLTGILLIYILWFCLLYTSRRRRAEFDLGGARWHRPPFGACGATDAGRQGRASGGPDRLYQPRHRRCDAGGYASPGGPAAKLFGDTGQDPWTCLLYTSRCV